MTLTIAVLSWGAHETLLNTLGSYRKHGLDQLDAERVIFFQEYSKRDREVASAFGYKSFGSPENIGIAEAYKLLVSYASGDLFLFLENDWELIQNPKEQIYDAAYLLEQGVIDVARLRSTVRPGEPLWSRQYKGNEYQRPEYLLDSVYWDRAHLFPEITQPDVFWNATSAKFANWTNNPTMFRTEWLRETIVPRIEGDIEVSLQPWWKEQDFRVGQGFGLFTHNRLDR